MSAALTRVLGSNVHEALLDATQLTPDAPSPRYHSTDKCSTVRVVKREEIFVTTKLWNTSHKPELVEKELDESLKQLQLDYVELYRMYAPSRARPVLT